MSLTCHPAQLHQVENCAGYIFGGDFMSIAALIGGLGGALSGSSGSGGSQQSGQSVSNSTSNYKSDSFSDSWSRTYGSEATAKSYAEAIKAHERQQQFFDETMKYNATEAYAQRAFNEMMGNTIYTRSIKNMMEAGINPILAANMGLSGASVNSGAAASISTPSTFMGQTFADQASASHSESHASGGSESSSNSSSSGSGWNNSESGLATGLSQLGQAVQNGLQALSSAKLFDITIGGKDSTVGKVVNDVKKGVEKTINKAKDYIKNRPGTPVKANKNSQSSGGGRKF